MSMINLFSGHALRSPHARNEMSWNMGQRQKMVSPNCTNIKFKHPLEVLLNDLSKVCRQDFAVK